MDLGVRQIRTAGKGSGSIELTLPAELRDLVGLPCRIILRDGSRPDIVLQPDLRRAHQAFASVWQAMATALLPRDADVPALPLAAFNFGLQPHPGTAERPFLCWRDGLALAGAAPADPAAIARAVAALAQAMAAHLPIAPTLAPGFGAACGCLVAGVPPEPDGQEACDIAAAALRVSHHLPVSPTQDAFAAGIEAPVFWRHAAPLLVAIVDLFAAWTSDPAEYAALRNAWRRGRIIEMTGDPSP